MRVALFCQQGMGEACLAWLAAKVELLVFIPEGQFDRSDLLRNACDQAGIKAYPAPSLSSPAWSQALQGCDLLLSATYPERFPEAILKLPGLTCLNLHPSALPALRGADPCFWAIKGGLSQSGLTLHRMTKQFDRGDILAQRMIAIDERETGGSLFSKLIRLVPEVLQTYFNAQAEEQAHLPVGTKQDDGSSSQAPRVKAEHLLLGADLTVADADCLVRAANPFYGARLACSDHAWTVWQAKPGSAEDLKEGVLCPSTGIWVSGGSAALRFADGWLELECVQFGPREVAAGARIAAIVLQLEAENRKV